MKFYQDHIFLEVGMPLLSARITCGFVQLGIVNKLLRGLGKKHVLGRVE